MATANPSQVTPEALVDLLVPKDARISPSGKHIVYSCTPIAKTGKHALSSLWIADIGKEHSARQFTSGLFNDVSPQWCPLPADRDLIAFESDRAKAGESSAIYLISLHGGEVYPVTKTDNKKSIASFKWSPDGHLIAFISSDEKTAEQEAREKETGEAKVYGQDWEYNRLRCLHVATREVFTLKGGMLTSQILVGKTIQKTPDLNSAGYYGVKFERVELFTRNVHNVCQERFPGPARDLAWLGNALYFLAGASPDKSATSSVIYIMGINHNSWIRYAYGGTSCAAELRLRGDKLKALIQNGLSDEIRSLDSNALTFGLEWSGLTELETWDSLNIGQGESREDLIALGKQSGDSGRIAPTEIYSFEQWKPMCQLSQHGQALTKFDFGKALPLDCKAQDGTLPDAILIRPSDAVDKYSEEFSEDEAKPQPTVVLIHGGPYGRITIAFNLLYYYWVPYLVSAGYAVLCPNYRGGSGRGEDHASQARGGMGTTDYSDIISLVHKGISMGLIDESRVAIGGWSQGGFLSYLAVTREDFHLKAAVCGAGVTDWDMMSMSSDAPWFESELAGCAPWETTSSDIKGRQGSPIWNMKDVKTKTPLLILHGEEDKRVPVSQAVAFHRGCLKYDWPCEMVIYPKEEHRIGERKHVVDMLKRIRRFYDFHLR
ncbi:hypothetical protein OEA41_003687 [Lepraria neglecta]|uniref:Dipeptidyl-peptidase V n=1 Tax=Lepraria neglecta TaxID=209136 RepID=A0AAD9Z6A1_9LECA|nr:hypothetical protein OEA41_003687 [Lepraria neglecta]